MESITNPHDRLFKQIWSDRDAAQDFLSHYLPPEILALMDRETLEVCKDSFIQEDLREYFSDLLYKVSLGNEDGYIYLLFEHKSHSDRLTPLQLLSYFHSIWRLHLKQASPPLPVIVPMVLYHGPTRWTGPDSLLGLLGKPDPTLLEYVPHFKILLYDFSSYSHEEIKGAVLTRATLMLLKHTFTPGFAGKLPEIFSLLRALLEKETGMQYLETILRYVFHTVEGMGAEDLKAIVEDNLSTAKGDFVMTLAQQIKNEGIQEGIQQGIQEGIQEGIQQGIREGRQYGLRQGLLEGIELAISIRFGARGMKLMPAIQKIEDLSQLEAIKETLKVTRKLSELEEVLKSLR